MKKQLVVDLTRSYPNLLGVVLGYARKYAQGANVAEVDIAVVATSDQNSLRSQLPSANWVQCAAFDAHRTVSGLVETAQRSGAQVHVLSWNNPLLLELAGRGVVSRHFASLREGEVASQRSRLVPHKFEGPEPQWPFDSLIPVDDAVDALVSVLKDRDALTDAKAIRQSQIRTWLGYKNPALAGGGAATRTSGLVGTLIHVAAVRGAINVAGDNPIDFFIWLKATEGSERGSDSAASPVSVAPETGAVSVAATSSAPEATSDDRGRVWRMREAIEKRKLGPFSDARPFVLQALDELVKEECLPLDTLVERALDQAKVQIQKAGKKLNQPWHPIRMTMNRLLLLAGVALDEAGKVIPNTWDGPQQRVASLADRWRTRTDAELVAAVIEELGDVAGSELHALACAVFDGPTASNTAKVYQAISYLMEPEQNRVVSDSDGNLRAVRRVAESSPTTALRALKAV